MGREEGAEESFILVFDFEHGAVADAEGVLEGIPLTTAYK